MVLTVESVIKKEFIMQSKEKVMNTYQELNQFMQKRQKTELQEQSRRSTRFPTRPKERSGRVLQKHTPPRQKATRER